MSDNKTAPTDVPVEAFLATVSDQRADEARALIAIMQDISGEQPAMWGPSIIGFGSQHYRYDTGREGDMGKLGFSPRKSAITIYFNEGFDRYASQMKRLGKYKSSVSCLYINKLADIDLVVLRSMLETSYSIADSAQKPSSVEDYVASVPPASREKFDELRTAVRSWLPDADEVLSYGIVGYKIDDKRARVFISGWKDHLAVYPIPRDSSLEAELAPYVKGKGTLWFPIDAPLPMATIKKVVKALTK